MCSIGHAAILMFGKDETQLCLSTGHGLDRYRSDPLTHVYRSYRDRLKGFMWLREFCSCSCLPVLPGPAWVLLSKICILFCRSLYLRLIRKVKFGNANVSQMTAFVNEVSRSQPDRRLLRRKRATRWEEVMSMRTDPALITANNTRADF